jgi:hypothetical protein
MRPLLLVVLASLASQGQIDSTTVTYINDNLYPATVLLYAQGENGGMDMRCTATAIEKTAGGYIFVTAAHCACEDDVQHKTTSPERTFFFVTPDEKGTKEFLKANPTGCGYRHRGDDFALFSVDTEKKFPVIPLGDDPKMTEQVINVASPLGLGKQVFFGTVSSPMLDRTVVVDDINWTGVVLLQMFGVNGGSSGSSLVCLNQKAICAFVVGVMADTTITAMPVSRLKKVREGIQDGTYKFWQPESDTPAIHTDKVKK